MSVEITKDLLSQIEWLNEQLKKMGKGFDRRLVGLHLGQTTEFIKGVLWERERQMMMNLVKPPMDL